MRTDIESLMAEVSHFLEMTNSEDLNNFELNQMKKDAIKILLIDFKATNYPSPKRVTLVDLYNRLLGLHIDDLNLLVQESKNNKHEGWSNKQTWTVAMTIDNSKQLLETVLDIFKTIPKKYDNEYEKNIALRDLILFMEKQREAVFDTWPEVMYLRGNMWAQICWDELAHYYEQKSGEILCSKQSR